MTHARTLGRTALGLALLTGSAMAQQPPAPPRAQPAQAQPANPAARARVEAGAARLAAGDLPGPIDTPSDILDTAKIAFMMADTNHDRQISQKEALDAGNLLVGGFFFRADANGDGTLSREEAQQARDSLLQQQPMLRFVLQRAQQSAAGGTAPAPGQPAPAPNAVQNPAQAIGGLLDANNDKQLQAAELRQAVQTAVEAMYGMADTNQDSQLTPAELNAAVVNAARTGITAAAKAADKDNNNALSKEEFAQALVAPGNVVFDILDANLDGQLTTDELERAGQIVVQQLDSLRIPEPANSPANVIGNAIQPNR